MTVGVAQGVAESGNGSYEGSLSRAGVGGALFLVSGFWGTQKRIYYAGTCLEAVGHSHDYDGRLPLRSLSRHVCSSTRAGAVDWMKSTSTSTKRCGLSR